MPVPPNAQDSSPILVQIQGVTKSYAGVKAVENVSLDLRAGEVHSLVGENGAGKSTLIKVLGGVVEPDEGDVRIDGNLLRLGSVGESEAVGVSVVHQESTAFPDLGVEDNLFIGREPRRFAGLLIDKRERRLQALRLLDEVGEVLPLDRPMSEFSVAQRQMVAMARALSLKSKLVILDEPTASLSAREADVLHGLVRKLKASGTTVLFVSHRLDEVLDLSDRVSVLRDGKLVETRDVADWTREGLISAMVGRAIDESSAVVKQPGQAEPSLVVRDLTVRGLFEGVSFSVSPGEIVGLGGLVGAGRSEVVQTVFGIVSPDSGSIEVCGHELKPGSVSLSVRSGIGLVPEDRQHQGLVLELSVGENLVMAVRSSLARWGWRNRRAESDVVRHQSSSLAIKAADDRVSARTLSGGNQQKVVIGKWLATRPKVLVLDEPTRGVDVGAKAEIHRLVRGLAEAGTAVLLVSSDLPELLALSDRIVVMQGGRVRGELSRADANQESVLRLALEPDRSAVAP